MSRFSDRLLARYYSDSTHPYRVFERQIEALVKSGVKVMLDAGCGRTVPVLKKYLGRVDRLIGVELVDFTDVPEGIETYNVDLAHLPLPDGSVVLIISRSVFEHLADPAAVYKEFSRVLTPGGRVIFLTANVWDYGTMIARMIPNRLHARIVKFAEGRSEEDTFPTEYRTNSRSAVTTLSADAGLSIEEFEYLSQYPNYLMFNGFLFMIGTVYEKLISRFELLRFLRGWILVTLVKPARLAKDRTRESSSASAEWFSRG